jgi:hypothetical protein
VPCGVWCIHHGTKAIYLATGQEERLKQIAQREHTTVSALIRDAVDIYLDEKGVPDVTTEEHPLWGIIGMIRDEDAPTDGLVSYKRREI